jgi:hypothetical protein
VAVPLDGSDQFSATENNQHPIIDEIQAKPVIPQFCVPGSYFSNFLMSQNGQEILLQARNKLGNVTIDELTPYFPSIDVQIRHVRLGRPPGSGRRLLRTCAPHDVTLGETPIVSIEPAVVDNPTDLADFEQMLAELFDVDVDPHITNYCNSPFVYTVDGSLMILWLCVVCWFLRIPSFRFIHRCFCLGSRHAESGLVGGRDYLSLSLE